VIGAGEALLLFLALVVGGGILLAVIAYCERDNKLW